ncbi:nicotinamide mononucleotide transport protein [Flavobacterium cauense R2A-7]|uniref:Nicotinamide riboside transporter PnuC n=1 Tax=Flavobacterium cauense R2A-7 TaxID=1341154 RepID=V6RZY4_9FLAO|nr:nicotinamide riboside transporter PnuC [Flavobacterium cauense]ESU19998.1 nicotinamide mononucleotide transport protein [Flavobacterium cauense R2A-7]KGO83803.1 nicotinamide mononucleotide transporter [Flavobacterium cauense R2A-7]TWI12422.1 nicotinamide mononucleotide transporter [Flavobacterium cauense R2A-7]
MMEFFLDAYKDASVARIVLEFIVFVCGIASVIFARKENILVYPTGLIATVITTYLLWIAGYLGDMIINLYFSVMSVYGWWNWARKRKNQSTLPITRTNFKEKIIGIALFFITIIVVFAIYKFFNYEIKKENYVDIVASGIFFTGMWYMAHKKIENWTLWIIGDFIVTPIYAYRGLGMLSLQYLIFTALAVLAYLEWRRIVQQKSI